jgi:hypothetical protein
LKLETANLISISNRGAISKRFSISALAGGGAVAVPLGNGNAKLEEHLFQAGWGLASY